MAFGFTFILGILCCGPCMCQYGTYSTTGIPLPFFKLWRNEPYFFHERDGRAVKYFKPVESGGEMKIVIAAGGTGGHIFPALSVALRFKKTYADVSFLWIGTTRSREVELCERHGIPIVLLNVAGIERKLTVKTLGALLNFATELFRMRSLFMKDRPAAIIAFGGYVCAPVLGAARLASVPYFIQEQNTVPE